MNLSASFRTKSNSDLEEVVRANLHNPAVLSAVHQALLGRTRRKAIHLRTVIEQQLAAAHVAGARGADIPIWTRAPELRNRTWPLVLTLLGFVGVGALHGVGFHLWQVIHQGLLSFGERLQLF